MAKYYIVTMAKKDPNNIICESTMVRTNQEGHTAVFQTAEEARQFLARDAVSYVQDDHSMDIDYEFDMAFGDCVSLGDIFEVPEEYTPHDLYAKILSELKTENEAFLWMRFEEGGETTFTINCIEF